MPAFCFWCGPPAPPPRDLPSVFWVRVAEKSRKPLTHAFSNVRLIWRAGGSQRQLMKGETQKLSMTRNPGMRTLRICGAVCRACGTDMMCGAQLPAVNGRAISGQFRPGPLVCNRGLNCFEDFGGRRYDYAGSFVTQEMGSERHFYQTNPKLKFRSATSRVICRNWAGSGAKNEPKKAKTRQALPGAGSGFSNQSLRCPKDRQSRSWSRQVKPGKTKNLFYMGFADKNFPNQAIVATNWMKQINGGVAWQWNHSKNFGISHTSGARYAGRHGRSATMSTMRSARLSLSPACRRVAFLAVYPR